MKVGIVTDVMNGKMGGFERYTRELVMGLMDVEWISLFLIHGSKSDDPLYDLCNEILVRKPHALRFIPRRFYESLNLIRHNLNVIHYPHQYMLSGLWRHHRLSFLYPLFKKELSLQPSRKVVTIHGVAELVLPPGMGDPTLSFAIRSIRCFAEKIHTVITVSNSAKEHIVEYLKIPEEKITVIYNGVDLTRFRPLENVAKVEEQLRSRYNITRPNIYHVSSGHPKKNVPSLIRAFYKLKKKGLKYNLIITGIRNRFLDNILRVIRELRLHGDVILTGHVPEDDLVGFYNATKLFVLPSFHESCPFPLLEAMACGSPVITSNVFSLPEITGDAAIPVDPRNIEELASKMYEVLTNENLREELRRRGLERIKMFSLEKFVREHVKVYKEIQ